MALKRLNTDEMVQISTSWLDLNSPSRQAIDHVPELAGLLPRVEAAHNAIHDAQPLAEDPRLAEISREEIEVDRRHDAVIRGIFMLLTALALLVGEGPVADKLLKLRALLLPDELEATQKSYRAEAGQGERLKSRLTPEAKKELKSIPVIGRTLNHFVDEWLAKAKRLGELEDERASRAPQTNPSEGAKIVAARNQWIRAVNALVANAALAELDEATDQTIFGALRLAEKAGDRRNKAPAVAAPEDAGTEEEPT